MHVPGSSWMESLAAKRQDPYFQKPPQVNFVQCVDASVYVYGSQTSVPKNYLGFLLETDCQATPVGSDSACLREASRTPILTTLR